MLKIGAFEAKNKLSALLDSVEQGEEVLITRHGKPVARLVPSAGGDDEAQARAAMARMRTRARQLKLGRFDWAAWKAERDEGRP